jgi:hypothetical protein
MAEFFDPIEFLAPVWEYFFAGVRFIIGLAARLDKRGTNRRPAASEGKQASESHVAAIRACDPEGLALRRY